MYSPSNSESADSSMKSFIVSDSISEDSEESYYPSTDSSSSISTEESYRPCKKSVQRRDSSISKGQCKQKASMQTKVHAQSVVLKQGIRDLNPVCSNLECNLEGASSPECNLELSGPERNLEPSGSALLKSVASVESENSEDSEDLLSESEWLKGTGAGWKRQVWLEKGYKHGSDPPGHHISDSK